MIEFSAERRLCVGSAYFKHRGLHKYRRVTKGQERVEVKSMIGLVLVKMDMLRYNAVRGMGRGLSDHHAVLCKVKLVGARIKRRQVVVRARRIRSEKLR